MAYKSMTERFNTDEADLLPAPISLGQEFRLFLGRLADRPAKRCPRDFVWSYDELGDGLPDDVPD